MRTQMLVVGLGQFGMALLKSLVANGVEVVGVDRRQDRVQMAAAFATEALRLDAMDEGSLARLAPGRRDVCICAIGDDSLEGSILVTALLRQLGARRLIARATNDLHARILTLVGAHEVVHPEEIFGERLAARLSYRGIVDVLPLGDDLVITEMHCPAVFAGRTLGELKLPARFNVTVVAVRREVESHGQVLMPAAELTLERGDTLVVVSPPGAAHTLAERV